MSAPVTPEFSLRIPLEKLSGRATVQRLEADAKACAALARRFDLVAIERLVADVSVERQGAGAHLAGQFEADVVQRCVVSGEPVAAHVAQVLSLRFEPATAGTGEIELDESALDVLFVEDGAVDVGEAVAQSLFLALDPYPRADEAVLARARALLLSEDEAEAAEAAAKAAASPFSALKKR